MIVMTERQNPERVDYRIEGKMRSVDTVLPSLQSVWW